MTDDDSKKILYRLVVAKKDPEVAYLYIHGSPDPMVKACRTVHLRDLLGHYEGPDVFFDFDDQSKLLGIELLAWSTL